MPRKGPTSESIHRHWAMLRLIPRAPRKIDTGTIERVLEQQGITITRRSIQRDLETLSGFFIGLRCDARSKPYGWCWDGKSPLLEVPGMSVQSAVTFELLRQHLSHVVPRATLRAMDPYFKRAREVLSQNPGAKMTRWPSKVRVVAAGLRRHPPRTLPSVMHEVYSALLEERRLSVRYRKGGAHETGDYEVSPLGLVLRDGALILVCTFWDYDEPRQMLLHRMASAEIINRGVRRPPRFDLDAFIAEGRVGYRKTDTEVTLRLRIDPRLEPALREAPLSTDQNITTMSDGTLEVEALVADTMELRTWLRGHGEMVEVMGPRALRMEIAKSLRAAAARYT